MNTKLFPFLTAILITLAPEGHGVVVSGCRLTGSLQSQELAPDSGYYHNTNTYIRFVLGGGPMIVNIIGSDWPLSFTIYHDNGDDSRLFSAGSGGGRYQNQNYHLEFMLELGFNYIMRIYDDEFEPPLATAMVPYLTSGGPASSYDICIGGAGGLFQIKEVIEGQLDGTFVRTRVGPVPEPGVVTGLGVGGAALLVRRRRGREA